MPRFIRDNAFLVAAVSLPVAVIGLFLLSTMVPRWTVPPPQYDLLLQTTEYNQSNRGMSVELFVRDERVHATVRRALENAYPPRVRLWRLDHGTLNLQEIDIPLPKEIPAPDAASTIVVDALRDRRIITDTQAPDGYEVRTSTHGGPGLIGDLFGMRRYDQAMALFKGGRTVSIKLPTPNAYQTPVFLGWVIEGGR